MSQFGHPMHVLEVELFLVKLVKRVDLPHPCLAFQTNAFVVSGHLPLPPSSSSPRLPVPDHNKISPNYDNYLVCKPMHFILPEIIIPFHPSRGSFEVSDNSLKLPFNSCNKLLVMVFWISPKYTFQQLTDLCEHHHFINTKDLLSSCLLNNVFWLNPIN